MKTRASSFKSQDSIAPTRGLGGAWCLGFLWSLVLGPSCFSLGAAELRDDWVDPDTGHRVVRLSRVPGQSQSLYFHQNGFTKSGDKLVFENTVRGDSTNRIFVCDIAARRSEPITPPGTKAILVGAKSRLVYHQRSNILAATHLDTHQVKTFAALPPRWRVSTVNADETLVAGTFVAGTNIDTSGPKSSWFNVVFDAKREQGMFTLELATGKTNIIKRGMDWYNHLQFSPTEPTLLQFCHEGPWHKLDRIWQVRTDGSGLKLMHERTMPMEIAGHEFWSPDGKTTWFDLQQPRGEKFLLAGVDIKSGKTMRYPIARNQWSVHYNISWDGKLFCGDGGSPGMVAKAEDGQWLYLFTPQPDTTVQVEKLVNMAKHDYDLEPNMQFTPDGKWIVFRGNFDGPAQVYGVEVARSGAGLPATR